MRASRSCRSRKSCAQRSVSSSATSSRSRSAARVSRSRLTNTRLVHWDSFRPNFFVVLSPGAIEHYAQTYITSLHVGPERRSLTIDLIRQFPSVSVIDVGAVIEQVRSSMDRAALAVQYVFLFTLAAGIMVLLAAIQATRDERMFESAVLRTLGARRSVVLQGVAAEFARAWTACRDSCGCRRRQHRLRRRDAAVQSELRAGRCSVAGWAARRRRRRRYQRHAGRALGRRPLAGRDSARRVKLRLRCRSSLLLRTPAIHGGR